ncbi:MAG: hypothetical protein CM15mP93_11230 [Thiotrichaceae bacterium]|nr:MAG: hypothetical protein CM15mP93_11230 [Thiotrichaceae bacterium]
MRRCLDLASISYENEEVPIGAVLTLKIKLSQNLTTALLVILILLHMQKLKLLEMPLKSLVITDLTIQLYTLL